ncbi:MAG: hypothetical protein HY350_04805 [Candidatus Omnitrophica bacterium]|nr:hypothetical protein [Candidatus Omnitrophota bacterium]
MEILRYCKVFLMSSLVMVFLAGIVYSEEAVLDITWRGFAQKFKLDNFTPNPDGWIQAPSNQKGNIAMEKFPYPDGTYKIKFMVYLDKKGFASVINLYINGKKLDSIKEDKDPAGVSAWYEFKDIMINQNDNLTIEGISDGEELVRLGRLQIIKSESQSQINETNGSNKAEGMPLQKADKSNSEVMIRKDNILLVNGKLLFPLGVTTGAPEDYWSASLFSELQQAGFNTVATLYSLPENKEKRDSLMALADKYNLMVVSAGLASKYIKSKKEKNPAEIEELMRNEIGLVQGYKNFIGWLLDEPVWAGLSNDIISDFYNKLRLSDPSHIYWINHAPRNTIEELAACNDSCDVTGSDIYPVPYPQTHSDLPNKTISVVGDETDKLIKTVRGKKPVWMVLQGFGWGPDHTSWKVPEESIDFNYLRRPNWEETRFMAYDAVIHGAKGIFYYGVFSYGAHVYKSSEKNLWTDIKRIISELHELSPVLVAFNKEENAVALNPENSGLEFIIRQCGEKTYIIAINTKDKSVSMEFKNLKGIDKMRVLFENNREVSIINGAFTDDFKKYDVHVYTDAK